MKGTLTVGLIKTSEEVLLAAQSCVFPGTKVAGVCWVDDAGAVKYLKGSGIPALSTCSLSL